MPYADQRVIQVRQYGDDPRAPGSEPEELVVCIIPSLPGSSDVDLNELRQTVEEAARLSGVHNYLLDGRHGLMHWGASGGTEEIVISLLSDPATQAIYAQAAGGAVSGAATALTERLINWSRQTRERNEERAQRVSGLSSLPTAAGPTQTSVGLDWMIMWSRIYAARAYEIEEGRLELEDAELKPNGAYVTFRDEEAERRIGAEVSDAGYLIRIVRLNEAADCTSPVE